MGRNFEQTNNEDDSLKDLSFRVVGEISEDAQNALKDAMEGSLHDCHYENLPKKIFVELKEHEIKKTKEQVELIFMADKGTNEIMKRVGVQPYGIPEKNIHLIPNDSYVNIELNDRPTQSLARAVSEFQAIFMNAGKIGGKITFASLVFHEMMHLKGKIILEVREFGDKMYVGPYKTGFTVFSPRAMDERKREHIHMEGLEEALVSDEEKRYTKKMYELPVFSSEKERMESERIKKIKKNMALREGIKEEDVFWVSEDEKKYLKISYPRQREVFNFVLEEILKENHEKYENIEAVREEFLKSFFGGSFYIISRLVEETFGKVGFRVLSLMTGEDKSAIGVMEALRSMRRAKEASEK